MEYVWFYKKRQVFHLIFLPFAAVLLDRRRKLTRKIRVNLCLFVFRFLRKFAEHDGEGVSGGNTAARIFRVFRLLIALSRLSLAPFSGRVEIDEMLFAQQECGFRSARQSRRVLVQSFCLFFAGILRFASSISFAGVFPVYVCSIRNRLRPGLVRALVNFCRI